MTIETRDCRICGNPFAIRAIRDNWICDKAKCRRIAKRNRVKPVCEICGFEIVDKHHEGVGRIEYWLCPNHHAMITRKKIMISQLLKGEGSMKDFKDKEGS